MEIDVKILLFLFLCGSGLLIGCSFIKNLSYTDFAIRTNDVTVCDELSKEDRVACYATFATRKDDVTVCDELLYFGLGEGFWDKGDCYINFAIKKDDVTVCDELSFGQRTCYIDFTQSTNGLPLTVDLEIISDISFFFTIYPESKKEGSISKSSGYSLKEVKYNYYGKDDLIKNYNHTIKIFNGDHQEVFSSSHHYVPYKEGFYKLQIRYEDGELKWGDLIPT